MLPDPGHMESIEEPVIEARLIVPREYSAGVMELCQGIRGVPQRMEYIGQKLVVLEYELPLGEVILDFYDKLKSISQGYASFDYEIKDYRPSTIVKMDILINGEPVDALSIIVHRSNAEYRGRLLAEKLKELVPRQQYDVAIQAALGGKIIARET